MSDRLKIPKDVTFNASIRSNGGRGASVTSSGVMQVVQVSTAPVLQSDGAQPLRVARGTDTGSDPVDGDQLVLPKGAVPVRFTMVSDHEQSGTYVNIVYNLGSLARPDGLWANLPVSSSSGANHLSGDQTYISGADSGFAASQYGGLQNDYPVYVTNPGATTPLNNMFGIIEFYMWNNGRPSS